MTKTSSGERQAYIITGPTSGIGHSTALEVAKHGTVVLVGRDQGKLDEVQQTIERAGQHAVSVVCDLSDLTSVRRAAAEISHSVCRSQAWSTTQTSSRCAPRRMLRAGTRPSLRTMRRGRG
jgi:NAD(P)-dependent dehydrogenase (short-subunit alcohol dehydrogenase family)